MRLRVAAGLFRCCDACRDNGARRRLAAGATDREVATPRGQVLYYTTAARGRRLSTTRVFNWRGSCSAGIELDSFRRHTLVTLCCRVTLCDDCSP